MGQVSTEAAVANVCDSQRAIRVCCVMLLFQSWIYRDFWVAVQEVPPSEFTPMRIRIAKANRQLDCSRAKADLGYIPEVSIKDALDRTVKHFAHLRNPEEGSKKTS